MSEIREDVDALQYRSYGEAIEEVLKKHKNEVVLNDGYLLKYHLQLRGFVVTTAGSSDQVPICPVYRCKGYTAGGHHCRHSEEHLKTLEAKSTAPVKEDKAKPEVVNNAAPMYTTTFQLFINISFYTTLASKS